MSSVDTIPKDDSIAHKENLVENFSSVTTSRNVNSGEAIKLKVRCTKQISNTCFVYCTE